MNKGLIRKIYGFSSEEIKMLLRYQYENESDVQDGIDFDDLSSSKFDAEQILKYLLEHQQMMAESGFFNAKDRVKKIVFRIRKEKEEKTRSATNSECEEKTTEDEKAHNPLVDCQPKKESSYYYKILYLVASISDFLTVNSKNSSEYAYELSSRLHFPVFSRLIIWLERFCYGDKETQNIAIDRLNMYVSRLILDPCRDFLDRREMERYKSESLMLLAKTVVLIKHIIEPSINIESLYRETIQRYMYRFSTLFYSKGYYKNAMQYSAKVMQTDDHLLRQRAFKAFGLSAFNCRQYQLAYDAFFSWINCSVEMRIGSNSFLQESEITLVNEKLKNLDESIWRADNPSKVADMYISFASLCGELYIINRNAEPRVILAWLADSFTAKAISMEKKKPHYRFMAGEIYKNIGNLIKSTSQYSMYLNRSEFGIETVSALRSILQNWKYYDTEGKKNIETYLRRYIESYQELKESVSKSTYLKDEIAKGSNLYYLLNECERIKANPDKIKAHLLFIDEKAHRLLDDLRRKSYSVQNIDLNIDRISKLFPFKTRNKLYSAYIDYMQNIRETEGNSIVAYYTTLKTAEYLLKGKDVTIKDTQKKDGDTEEKTRNVNYLTMMHARHMNDPEEGICLVRDLEDYSHFKADHMRESLYNQKYVFLKSFTGQIDQLNMWTTYGSDRTDGKDCNGCCICFDPETFELVSLRQEESEEETSIHIDDDYDLYDVAYINGEDIYVSGKKSDEVTDRYKEFKIALRQLSDVVEEDDKDIVEECLVRLLEKLMFLFKKYDYHMESESRIIISRDLDDRDQLDETKPLGSEPPKLFINPPFQVFPEQIILGPKVEKADDWIPHLQYELSMIKDKWFFGDERKYNPIVSVSKINIR